jgi:hypothetical protein
LNLIAQNPKFETRNPKTSSSFKEENAKHRSGGFFGFLLALLNLFRILDFDIRIRILAVFQRRPAMPGGPGRMIACSREC